MIKSCVDDELGTATTTPHDTSPACCLLLVVLGARSAGNERVDGPRRDEHLPRASHPRGTGGGRGRGALGECLAFPRLLGDLVRRAFWAHPVCMCVCVWGCQYESVSARYFVSISFYAIYTVGSSTSVFCTFFHCSIHLSSHHERGSATSYRSVGRLCFVVLGCVVLQVLKKNKKTSTIQRTFLDESVSRARCFCGRECATHSGSRRWKTLCTKITFGKNRTSSPLPCLDYMYVFTYPDPFFCWVRTGESKRATRASIEDFFVRFCLRFVSFFFSCSCRTT